MRLQRELFMNKMKQSRVEWIGVIPEKWELRRWKNILKERKEKNDPIVTDFILSLSIEQGVFPYSEKKGGGNKAKDDLSAYKVARPNDIVINSMNILAGAVGLSSWLGAVSPVYYTFYSDNDCANIDYYYYLFQTKEFQKSLMGLGNGILIKESSNGKLNTIRMRIPSEKLNCLLLPIPPISEQQQIAKFLDEKTALIDDIITDTKQTIEELKSYKQSLTSEIVTKGINKNGKLVPSGIEWIGEVPEEWEVLKSRYFLNEISVKGYPDEEVLSLYRDYGIIPKNSRSDNHNVTSSDTSGYKLVKPGNLVINKMKAWQGSMAISNLRGIVSPAYYTFEVDNERFNLRFLHYALRNPAYKQEYMRISAGLRVGQWDLNKNEFKNLKYAFPANKEEQKAIADYLDEKISQIDTLITEKENVISEYENYKKSMIYEYVTGKKRVEGYES